MMKYGGLEWGLYQVGLLGSFASCLLIYQIGGCDCAYIYDLLSVF